MQQLLDKPSAHRWQARLDEIETIDNEVARSYRKITRVQPNLTRSLVSFQANKRRPGYRWYKYKEAFSAPLVEHLLDRVNVHSGTVFDPFAGSGTTLFVASSMGLTAEGVELLPIGQEIIRTKQLLEFSHLKPADLAVLEKWQTKTPWKHGKGNATLPELRITKGAYPPATATDIGRYRSALQKENEIVQAILRFALLCVLENVSFTRKDGQYLRWDYRSGRRQGSKPFNKGNITNFAEAVQGKLAEILADLKNQSGPQDLFPSEDGKGPIQLHRGSCLKVTPTLAANHFDAIITSPPYCNRYDYTRTYALELALLGVGEEALAKLRQEMLSCTVENRGKDLLAMNPRWSAAITAVKNHALLQAILNYLEDSKTAGELNNNGIPRMVRGYFEEMACVIHECSRVLKCDAALIMVNDNVRYAGAGVSVDFILTAIAEQLGFRAEAIWVLPGGKGNSSQQMGRHGRTPLRKCVYVWRRL